MGRPYKEFVEKWVGKSVDYDKAYGAQCTDVLKQYMDECLGMGKIGTMGNAKDVPSGPYAKKFTIFTNLNNIMQGDIIVRTAGTYGHIAIVDHVLGDKIYVLEQNGAGYNSGDGKGANAIRVHGYNKSFFQVIMRNEAIVKNFNQELSYVDEKIKEREEILKITKEYKDTLTYKK